MRLFTRIISLFGIGLISLFATRPVLAFPPLPSSFYGTVKTNGENVPDGTPIKALIKGKVYAEGQTQTYQGDSVYALDIPGDDLSSTIVEGGLEGETIVFTIAGTEASQTGSWKSGTNINLNLSITTTEPEITSTAPQPMATTAQNAESAAQNNPQAPQNTSALPERTRTLPQHNGIEPEVTATLQDAASALQNTPASTPVVFAQASLQPARQLVQTPTSEPDLANAPFDPGKVIGIIEILAIPAAIIILWQTIARRPKNKH